MGRREELVRAEDEAWAEIRAVVDRLSRAQLEEPGYTPEGWSVKDLLAHIGCWSAECAHVLERIRIGAYEEQEYDVDAVNREWFEACRDLDLSTVRAEWIAARNRLLQEWAALPEITSQGEEWFEESGPLHYQEHLVGLREWIEVLASRAESPRSPGSRP